MKAAWAVENGAAEAVMKMSFGNGVGFAADGGTDVPWYAPCPGAIVAELTEDDRRPLGGKDRRDHRGAGHRPGRGRRLH